MSSLFTLVCRRDTHLRPLSPSSLRIFITFNPEIGDLLLQRAAPREWSRSKILIGIVSVTMAKGIREVQHFIVLDAQNIPLHFSINNLWWRLIYVMRPQPQTRNALSGWSVHIDCLARWQLPVSKSLALEEPFWGYRTKLPVHSNYPLTQTYFILSNILSFSQYIMPHFTHCTLKSKGGTDTNTSIIVNKWRIL